MKDKTIVLADSSYTIRRIVELSFSEIEDVEIVSFENGQDLKDKLLEILPRVVIVDVKLPGISGYEICQFINQTDTLKKTKIFLMKGSFEPVNQEWIKNLKYEEIITKPFDSNLLVAAVMKILVEGDKTKTAPGFPESIPVSMPEDFASIETGTAVEDELSFSDIRDEILVGGQAAKKPVVDDEDIQPSEEITQAQAQKEDALAPEGEESIANPFESEGTFSKSDIQVGKPGAKAGPEAQVKADIGISRLEEGMGKKETPGGPFTKVANEETSETVEKVALETEKAEPVEEGQFPGDLLDQPQMNIDLPIGHEVYPKEGFPAEEVPKTGLKRENSGISHIFSGETKRLPVEKEPEKEMEGRFSPTETPKKKMAKNDLLNDIPQVDKKEIETRLNEQLSQTIREVLWEIIPRLAEKIIREEIEKIKAEIPKPEK